MTSARDFTLRLQDLLRRERLALADFLVALSDFDERRLWIELGYTSLFYFLHRELGLSKGAAHYRKIAAELIRKFPEIVEPLRDGRLCLTTVVELSKVMTPENRDEVLPRFFQLSRTEAKEVTAELRPVEAPLRDVVTSVRAPASPGLALSLPATPDLGQPVQPANQPKEGGVGAEASRSPTPVVARAAPVAIEPLTAEASRVHVTVSRRFLKKLEAARDALSHSHPGAGMEEILEAGLDLLLERDAKRKALVRKPRTTPRPSADPEYVPAHVRRTVWERDGGKCQFPVACGGVCGSTVRVELHHRRSRHRGGPPSVENLTTLCGFHHDVETRREFGDGYIDGIVRKQRERSSLARFERPLSP